MSTSNTSMAVQRIGVQVHPSVLLMLSVAAQLLDEAHELREFGDWGAVSRELQARQLLAESIDRLR